MESGSPVDASKVTTPSNSYVPIDHSQRSKVHPDVPQTEAPSKAQVMSEGPDVVLISMVDTRISRSSEILIHVASGLPW